MTIEDFIYDSEYNQKIQAGIDALLSKDSQKVQDGECSVCKGQAYFDGRNTCKVCNK